MSFFFRSIILPRLLQRFKYFYSYCQRSPRRATTIIISLSLSIYDLARFKVVKNNDCMISYIYAVLDRRPALPIVIQIRCLSSTRGFPFEN